MSPLHTALPPALTREGLGVAEVAPYRNHPPVLEPQHSIAQEQPRESEESQNLVWRGEAP